MAEKPRVLVLGCGPAGLFAAHAAESLGFAVDIGSKKRRSEMFGAQYLHTNIPGLTDDQEPFKVEYRLNGNLDAYLRKVYGPRLPDKVTVDSLIGTYDAWDIRRAYMAAWQIYHPRVINTEHIDAKFLGKLLKQRDWRAVVSTIPANDICLNRDHFFTTRRIQAIGDAPERGVFAPEYISEPNVIQYDGTDGCAWYRASNIAGYNAVEWPQFTAPPSIHAAWVDKPVRSNCACWLNTEGLPPVFRVGRYGAWSREQHTHNAYWSTLEALKDLA